MFILKQTSIGKWDLPVLQFIESSYELSVGVVGLIGNSITTSVSGRERTRSWKVAVGETTKKLRYSQLSTSNVYAITVGFSFHLPSHGNRELDAENFIKPTLDALAAGLFCAEEFDVSSLERWDFDDSGFKHLLVHRLPDVARVSEEGAALFVSVSS